MPLNVQNQIPVGIYLTAVNTREFVQQLQTQLARHNVGSIKATVNSKGFAKAEVSMRRLGKQTKQTTSFLDDFANKSALAFKRYTAFSLATFGFLRFTRGISSAFDRAVKFERELVRIAQVTDKPLSGLKGLTDQIFDLSTALGVSSTELAESARLLSQAGFTASETKQSLQALAKTDVAPNFKNIKDTTEAAIAILRQFRHEQLNVEDAFDAINKSASRFAFDAQDITAAVKRAGSTFSEAGGQFDEFVALFGTIRQQTRQAPETIATAIRTLIPRLQRRRTVNLLETLGISIREDKDGLRNQFIGPLRAIEEISKGIERIGNVRDPRVFEVVQQLGGVRRIESVIPVITNYAKVQKILNVAREEGSSLDEDALIAQQSLEIQLKKLTAEFDRLFNTIEQNTALRGLISQTTQLVTALAQLANFVGSNDILSSLLAGGLSVGAARLFGSFGRKTATKFFTARNSGGPIPGRGPNKDDRLIAVTGGEYVLRRKAVDQIGINTLNDINRTGRISVLNDDSIKNRDKDVFKEALDFTGKVPGFVDGGYVKPGYRLTIGKDGKKYYFDPDGKRVSATNATTNVNPSISARRSVTSSGQEVFRDESTGRVISRQRARILGQESRQTQAPVVVENIPKQSPRPTAAANLPPGISRSLASRLGRGSVNPVVPEPVRQPVGLGPQFQRPFESAPGRSARESNFNVFPVPRQTGLKRLGSEASFDPAVGRALSGAPQSAVESIRRQLSTPLPGAPRISTSLREGFSTQITSSGQRIFKDPNNRFTSARNAIDPDSAFARARRAQNIKFNKTQEKLINVYNSEASAIQKRLRNNKAIADSRRLTFGLNSSQINAALAVRNLGASAGDPGAITGGGSKFNSLFARQQQAAIAAGNASAIPFTNRERGQLAAVRTGERLRRFGRGIGNQLTRPVGSLSGTRLGRIGQRVAGFGAAAGGFANRATSGIGRGLAGATRAFFPAAIATGITSSVVSGLDDRAAGKALEGRSGDAADDIIKGSGVGIAGGVATGALVGSVIPGLGTAVGALAGGAVVAATEFESFNNIINSFGFNLKTTNQKIAEAEQASEDYAKQLDEERKQQIAAKKVAAEAARINEIVLVAREKEIRALRNISALETAFGAAAASIEPIINRLNTSSVASTNVSGLLDRAGQGQLDVSEFGTLDAAFRGILGGTGRIGSEVGQLAAIESVANKIIPQVIDRTGLRARRNPGTEEQPFDFEGSFIDDLSNSLRSVLPQTAGIDSFVDQVAGRVFQDRPEDFTGFDPRNRQDTIEKALDSTNLRALNNIFDAQVKKNQDLSEILDKRLQAEENATNAINDANQLRFGFAKQAAETFGNRDFGLRASAGLNNSRLEQILGGVSGTNIRDIAGANRAARGRLENIQGSIVGTATDEQRRAAEKEIETINRTTRALQELSSNTTRLSEIQDKLSRLEEERLTKRDFAAGFAFGTNEDRRNIAQSIVATRQAASTGSLEGLSETQRGQVGELLSQFENVQSSVFGTNASGEALTGGELRDRLLGGFVGQTEGLVTPSKEERQALGQLGRETEVQALATELLGTIGNETQKLAQAAIDINQTFANTVEQSLSASLNANILDPLTKALNNIPSEINGNFNHKVEVVFNGAEVLSSLMPQIESIALKQAQTELNKFIGNNFPDLPSVNDTA